MQSTDLKPPLGSVAFFTHQDYQSEQYQIAYVHQPVKLQDHGIIKKRKGDHDNKPRNYTRHLFGLLGRFRTADGYDADDGQCKYQYVSRFPYDPYRSAYISKSLL